MLIEGINKLLEISSNKLLFAYDTTFNIGDFYMSTLVCRHNYLIGDPPIPIAFFFHDTKEEKMHEEFFLNVKKVSATTVVVEKDVMQIVLKKQFLLLVATENRRKRHYCNRR